VSYSISGMPTTGYEQLIEKSDKTYELAIWGEAFRSGASTPITINLDTSYSTINVYDITLGTSPVQTLSNVDSVALALTDHLFIMEFK
jgi:hypothetical protein